MENRTPPPPRTLKMIKYGTLPFENIAHDLFMDVAQWHTLEHPDNMRHSEKVKHFWSVGFKLFNERSVRYMGRHKNKGEYWLFGIVVNLLLYGGVILILKILGVKWSEPRRDFISNAFQYIHERSECITK